MKFPKDATKSECKLQWYKIAEIKDADFGFVKDIERPTGTRFSTRCVLFNENNEICIIDSGKYGYRQIPGGGIDEGESIIDGLYREMLEEAGWQIEEVKPLGYIHEYRENTKNKKIKKWSESIDFVFVAKTKSYSGTHYVTEEAEEDFRPVWILPKQALEYFESQVGQKESYSSNFANMRDLQILKYLLR